MMHIAFLTPEYPHPKVKHCAGIGTSIKNLVEALAKQKVKVSVFIYGQNSDEVIEQDTISIHLIKQLKYPFTTWYFYKKHVQEYINSIAKKEQIDLIEAPDWTGFTAFMNFDIPLIIRFHGSDAYFCRLEERKQKWKNQWLEKSGIAKAKAFIAPTLFAGTLTKEIFNIQHKTIEKIHYGIHLEEFYNPNPEQYEEGLILYIGTIIRKKGVFELPEILKKVSSRYPNAHLVLIGNDASDIKTHSPSTWQLLQELFKDQNVSYLGKIPYSEVKEQIKKANVCVFPTFAETQGMVTIEAMALNKAVVNSNIGWAQELIVDGESGFLVHPKDHQKYADTILELLNNKEHAIQIGVNARKRVEEHFEINTLAQHNIEYYQSILAQK
ncbi:glycosyltransferase family 4 protein [Flavobacterium sp. SUN046]|uniref:glycosyltransferase family 4 protein n=1 Tax=Flavobacterium sp. SUN046 TaxID=3002440 RepID=UPI002DBB77DB|nr:glycosyltransferase family 4 protein [Flavobacterium sp. SUN046]MEC4050911.1 glycosyltransferase family 4 protein [Flavobacterium sp. SUN046]